MTDGIAYGNVFRDDARADLGWRERLKIRAERTMQKFIRIFLGVAGCGVLCLVLISNTEHQAQASNPSNPSAVFVTNNPLPVQGAVSVSNTPSVNVANTASVNVANSPTVTLGNASVPVGNALDAGGNVVPLVTSQHVEPYESTCEISTSLFGSGKCVFDAIPAGKQLVVQEFDISSQSQTGHLDQIILQVSWKGANVNHYFAALSNGTDAGGTLHQVVNQQTTIYSDTSFSATPACSTEETAPYLAFCAISGYLIPAQ